MNFEPRCFGSHHTYFDSRNFELDLTAMALAGYLHKCLDFVATIATIKTMLASGPPA
jgi:hypothetical protein